jgi:hypothetical protein
VLHRENGDTIYSVTPLSASLAHVIRPEDRAPLRPNGKVEYADVLQYWQAIGNRARSPAEFQWLHNGAARIRASLRRDDLVSVQVAGFAGWKAWVGAERKPVSADALGFLLIQPRCEGNCEIALSWTGRPDLPFAAAISVLALLALAVMFRTHVP